ncbi:MAG: CapA family protein [Deferrisomatales bacterium]|nr:CapA family protein [Deferrisomatales bacterium]
MQPTESLQPPEPGSVRLAAVGDLLFTTPTVPGRAARGLEALGADVRELLGGCHVVLANLEATLPGGEKVPTEPRVIATEEQIRSLSGAGIGVVTLANNHAFDCMDEGFQRLRALLDELGIVHFGAGGDRAEALQPAVVEIGGQRLAFLGTVDPSTGPNRFASPTASGVDRLDIEEFSRAIQEAKRSADHVIVSPHWGEERFRVPAPRQVEEARAFVDAGAALVLGHHPHVLQGMERYRGTPIAYSLGNFLTNHVYWDSGAFLTWSRFERTGCIVVADLDASGLRQVRQVPTYDDGETIRLETSGWGERCLRTANRRVARGVTPEQYRRERFRVERLEPILRQLRWARLKKIRPGHFTKAARLLLGR